MEDQTVYVIGHGKTQLDNPIQNQFNAFFMTFLVDVSSDLIRDVSGTFVLKETNQFIKSLFIGMPMTIASEILRDKIERRYWGSSQKAIIVAFKDAQRQYTENKKRYFSEV